MQPANERKAREIVEAMSLNDFFTVYSKFKEYQEAEKYTGTFDDWLVTIEALEWDGLSLDKKGNNM